MEYCSLILMNFLRNKNLLKLEISHQKGGSNNKLRSLRLVRNILTLFGSKDKVLLN